MHLRSLIFAGLMAALGALLQTAPVWLGQPLGFALAVLACLPPAVSALQNLRAAVMGVAAAALLCGLISPEEAWVFGLTNGPFGVALGYSARAGYGLVRAVILAAGVLLAGILLLTWGLGFAALGSAVLAWGVPAAGAVFTLFALVWAFLFTGVVRLIWRRLLPAMRDDSQG
ncbi:MAG: hypothetical protein ACOY94_10405 [Bacillota bacterium]